MGQGRGTPQDYEQAVFWYRKAARQKVADAHHLLCLSYSLGHGVVSNRIKGYAWCQVAVAFGSEDAKAALPLIAKTMTTTKVKAGKHLSARIIRRIQRQ
jgi:TPR repeat protein